MKTLYLFQDDLRSSNNALFAKAYESSDQLFCAYVKPDNFDATNELGFVDWGKQRKKVLLQALDSLSLELQVLNLEFLFFENNQTLKSFIQENKIDVFFKSLIPYKFESEILNDFPKLTKVVSEPNSFLTSLNESDLSFKDLKSFIRFRKIVETKKWPTRSLTSNVKMEANKFALGSESYLKTLKVKHWVKESLSDLNQIEISFDLKGDRSSALNHVKNYIWNLHKIKNYKETRNGMLEFFDSTKLSAWLALGVLSPVEVFKEILEYEKEVVSNSSTYWLKLELLWRDYFKHVGLKYGDLMFSKAGLEEVHNESSIPDQKTFHNWTLGKTRNSFINANMIELKTTGFMSNRGRQNVASYLCHELNLPWTWGARWFESCLIDYDPSSNYGNWQYISGAGGWGPHKFDYDWQSQTYDPYKLYQKKWSG